MNSIGANSAASLDLPAYCRVAATIKPTADSDIEMVLWIPVSEWNRKLLAIGNGGWAGGINTLSLAFGLREHYATVSTDRGHNGSSASFALGHPEKLTDFAYRAVHEMTLQTKAIIAVYYGNAPKYSYFTGCSSGGDQGLREAQRYPEDYDGVVAGAPGNYWTHLMATGLWIAQATLKDKASFLPPANSGCSIGRSWLPVIRSMASTTAFWMTPGGAGSIRQPCCVHPARTRPPASLGRKWKLSRRSTRGQRVRAPGR